VAPASVAPATYKIGYSNGGGVGNGFREEQVCTAKAQATASGQVSELTTIHRNTDAAGQLQDLRDLIAKGVDAIVFNPNDPAALNPALEEAKAAGILTVAVDAYTTNPDTYNLYNNQVDYAYLGAKWLFEQMGGKGNVYYMRGFAGHPADNDRDIGFRRRLPSTRTSRSPERGRRHTGWDPATTTQLITDWISSGQYDNTQASDVRHGLPGRRCDQGREQAVRADRRRGPRAFVAQLLDEANCPGLVGARDEYRRRRWRGRRPRAQAPEQRERPDRSDGCPAEHGPPQAGLATNATEDGKALLKSWQVDGLDPLWPLGLQIEGFTTYTPEQAVACKGPGE
jgi:ribose transport system substrate-binding protein